MQYTILAFATVASYVSAQAVSNTPSPSPSPIGAVVPVGGLCNANSTICALGSQCYSTNFMLQTVCGNFQAACKNNQQCAFNACNEGFCNGPLLSSSSSASAVITTTPTGGFTPAPSSTITAAAGSLPLGAECNAFANPSQCVAGVQCWASNSGLIARCGNFNAVCSNNAQCAYNSCNSGLCNGFLPSSAGNATTTVQSTRSSSATQTGSATRTGSATATTSMAQFTGAASVANINGGVMAIMFGAVAWIL